MSAKDPIKPKPYFPVDRELSDLYRRTAVFELGGYWPQINSAADQLSYK